ncbi:PREDICTED: phospholipase A2 inhibitor and Ly6/PLAUR domain-containing protein-like [Nanorana parkeri]|uniref:phospholipase A2 inhibitor and Ly6/PLAUR domain-containing protein-like n=1 Tax=Nanorana parkeri TaxID=125878 RepID=UPI000854C543|nr:PREDICTED: phospholipase A2 inhibitor and Ly6/PLAUR domain-containing protein-like [Nanorana parkeri]
MELVLKILLIVSISIATGTCLVCEKCKNFHGETCNETQTTTEVCDKSVTQCRTTIMVETFGNISYWQTWKSCVNNPLLCSETRNMSVGYELFKKTVCCKGDLCNKGAIKLESRNRTENGVECPSCYARAKSCTVSNIMKCQGPQTRCLSFSGRIFNSTQFELWAYKGCTTESACLYRAPPYPDTLLQRGYRLYCNVPKQKTYNVKS